MDLGFTGEVAGFYHTYRRGYPAAAIDVIAAAFRLTADDIAVDLGCGTGQLTVPLAGRVRAVLGVDLSPDMLSLARRAHAQVANVSWLLGADTDVGGLAALLGGGAVAALTVGQALHWMRYEELFREARPLLRAGGGIAIVTNGTPLWLQPTAWSGALRTVLQEWLQDTLRDACGTDSRSQQAYQQSLAAAGFEVAAAHVEYTADLSLDEIVGGVFSAMPRWPAPSKRRVLGNRIRRAVAPYEPCREHVDVAVLTARLR
jgi:SAM-dependent methyltransferase